MMRLVLVVVLIFALAMPVSAADITAPPVPESGRELMPEDGTSFGQGLWEICCRGFAKIRPDIAEGARICFCVIAAAIMLSILSSFPGMTEKCCDLVGAVCIAGLLLGSANSLIRLGTDTVQELSQYGKLLLPVMTTALAAQGGLTASASLYVGTAAFDTLLSSLITTIMVPLVYLYLALAAANAAMGEDLLKKLRDFLKWLMTWTLKMILYVFTGYMGITGVVSGTTDAAALKATKLTISGVVPVVGGILSDASEAVLISAGVVKNAAGIYGIFAVLALIAEPFLRIGVHYLILKLTAAICGIFGSKRITELIGDFNSVMGLLLAMTGTVCLMILISTVCFLRGVG